MKENISNKLLLICCLLAMVGCKAKKLVVTNPNNGITVSTAHKPVNQVEQKLDPIRALQLNFNTFSGKAHTSLNINGSSNDVTLNIRINKDRKIWVSITALLGIEVARALITPDSIQVVNRLQGIYLKKPFSFIYAFANKQVNYTMLQALLVGNAVPSLLNDSTRYQSAANNITLSGNLQDILYTMVLGTDMRVTQTDLSNQGQGLSLRVSDNMFIPAGNQTVPSQIDIASVAKNRKIQVNLHYVKVDLNQPQDYPFNIPDNYTPAE